MDQDKIEIETVTAPGGKCAYRAVVVSHGKVIRVASERDTQMLAELDAIVLRQLQKKAAEKHGY